MQPGVIFGYSNLATIFTSNSTKCNLCVALKCQFVLNNFIWPVPHAYLQALCNRNIVALTITPISYYLFGPLGWISAHRAYIWRCTRQWNNYAFDIFESRCWGGNFIVKWEFRQARSEKTINGKFILRPWRIAHTWGEHIRSVQWLVN